MDFCPRIYDKAYRPYALTFFHGHIHMTCRCGQKLGAYHQLDDGVKEGAVQYLLASGSLQHSLGAKEGAVQCLLASGSLQHPREAKEVCKNLLLPFDESSFSQQQ
jgi:hypothetical protein